jgi:competence protein ComEC
LKTTTAPAVARPAQASGSGNALAALGRFLAGAINDQALRWPLLLPLALMLGAALYVIAPFEPAWPVLAGWTAPMLLVWSILQRRGGGRLALLFGILACLGLGAIAGKVRTGLVLAPILREEIGPVRIEGVIAEIDASERSRRIRIDVRAVEDLTPEQTPKYVRFSYKGDIPFNPGRAVVCKAILSPPPRPVVPGDYEFHRDAYFQQLGGVGFATGKCEPLSTPPSATFLDRAFYWIQAVRRAISEHVFEEAGEKGGGMSAAMVAGDRSLISPDDSEALRLSGLAHLLSISGVHMVLAGGIAFFIIRYLWVLIEPLALRVPAVKAAAFGAVIACTLYFIISGMEVATQRSYVMALIAFGAKLFDRPALSLRSIAIALFVVVLLQPESVVTPGFQMSFAASGALIALYEVWPKLDRPDRPGFLPRIPAWVIGAAATSVTASAATMPFALYHFDRAALFSVIANIASTPIITLWTTPAAAAAAITAPFGLEGPFLALMGKSVEVVLAIARWSVDASPDFDLPRMSATGLAWCAATIAVFCLATRRGRVLALIPFAAAVFTWLSAPQAIGYVATDGSVFLKTVGKGWLELTDWRDDNGLNPLIIGDEIGKAPCMGNGSACWLDLPAGQFSVAPDMTDTLADRSDEPCPTAAALTLTPNTGQKLVIHPCDYAGKGGAVIEIRAGSPTLRTAKMQSGRAWTQPLYEKPARKRGQNSKPQ